MDNIIPLINNKTIQLNKNSPLLYPINYDHLIPFWQGVLEHITHLDELLKLRKTCRVLYYAVKELTYIIHHKNKNKIIPIKIFYSCPVQLTNGLIYYNRVTFISIKALSLFPNIRNLKGIFPLFRPSDDIELLKYFPFNHNQTLIATGNETNVRAVLAYYYNNRNKIRKKSIALTLLHISIINKGDISGEDIMIKTMKYIKKGVTITCIVAFKIMNTYYLNYRTIYPAPYYNLDMNHYNVSINKSLCTNSDYVKMAYIPHLYSARKFLTTADFGLADPSVSPSDNNQPLRLPIALTQFMFYHRYVDQLLPQDKLFISILHKYIFIYALYNNIALFVENEDDIRWFIICGKLSDAFDYEHYGKHTIYNPVLSKILHCNSEHFLDIRNLFNVNSTYSCFNHYDICYNTYTSSKNLLQFQDIITPNFWPTLSELKSWDKKLAGIIECYTKISKEKFCGNRNSYNRPNRNIYTTEGNHKL